MQRYPRWRRQLCGALAHCLLVERVGEASNPDPDDASMPTMTVRHGTVWIANQSQRSEFDAFSMDQNWPIDEEYEELQVTPL